MSESIESGKRSRKPHAGCIVDASDYHEEKPKYTLRICWTVINKTIFRAMPGVPLAHQRNRILRLFGAKVPKHCNIYHSARIFAPWNLTVGLRSTIGPNVQVYNKAPVNIGSNVTISQGSHICTASHSVSSTSLALVLRPIDICDGVWVAAECFIGPGVTLAECSVLSARSVLFTDADAYSIYRGNPAQKIRKRVVDDR